MRKLGCIRITQADETGIAIGTGVVNTETNSNLEALLKFFTDELVELFREYPLYSQQDEEDPLVVCRFFDPCESATWCTTELDPVERIAFG